MGNEYDEVYWSQTSRWDELNGRQMYDDAQKDLEVIAEKMSNTYELPPLDMIG